MKKIILVDGTVKLNLCELDIEYYASCCCPSCGEKNIFYIGDNSHDLSKEDVDAFKCYRCNGVFYIGDCSDEVALEMIIEQDDCNIEDGKRFDLI